MRRSLVLLAASAGVAALALPVALRPAPALIWNTTASAPVGLYVTQPARAAGVGDWVVVRPPGPLAAALAGAGFLPLGVPLLKRIAAAAPSTVCRDAAVVSVDGRAAATALADDRFGRALPVWRGCRRLSAADIFLLNPEPRSYDSRYFGPLPARAIVAKAAPLLVTGRAGDAR